MVVPPRKQIHSPRFSRFILMIEPVKDRREKYLSHTNHMD
jgi:hypothetical protein